MKETEVIAMIAEMDPIRRFDLDDEKLSNTKNNVDDYDDDLDENDRFDLFTEATKMWNIAFPTFVIQFSVFVIFPETASVVGRHLGTEALTGYSLASLTGNLTCLTLIVGVLSAADTLMPRAFATNNFDEYGRLAIRGFVACSIVLYGPFTIMYVFLKDIYVALGQEEEASILGAHWMRIYIIGVPFVLWFRVLQRILGCQGVVWPLGLSAAIGAFLIHPVLLYTLVPLWGFTGSAVAVTLTQASVTLLTLMFVYLKPTYREDTWPILTRSSVEEATKLGPMMSFLKLGIGGVFSLSEWLFFVSEAGRYRTTLGRTHDASRTVKIQTFH